MMMTMGLSFSRTLARAPNSRQQRCSVASWPLAATRDKLELIRGCTFGGSQGKGHNCSDAFAFCVDDDANKIKWYIISFWHDRTEIDST